MCMKRNLFIVSTLLMAVFCSCVKDEGTPITKEFSVSGSYNELEVSGAFDVTVSDEVDCVTVTAGDNIMSDIEVEKVGNTLKIHLKPFASSYNADKKVLLPYNDDLKSISLSGASSFQSDYTLQGIEVNVELSGASNFQGFVDVHTLNLEMSGASEAVIEGETSIINADLSGASTLERVVADGEYALSCDQCDGSLSGASKAFLHCARTLRVSLSGASELHYSGNASTAGSSTSGGSDIIHDRP